jgi:serine/threonine-protein kinase
VQTVATLLPGGTSIGGDFVIVRPLGGGGMGEVYVAEQRSTGKLRALKVMRRDIAPNEELLRRFEREARVGAQIRSGHIVEVLAAGLDVPTGLPFLVMELLEGVDVRTYLTRRGPLLIYEVYELFEQLCHGVGAAHAVGVVHRDLKPENIFLTQSNQAGATHTLVKVLDFGIAKLASEAGTRGTSPIGSPLWMAPEQTEPGPITPAADVWALGLIAYEMLVGQSFWRSAHLPTATPMQLLREIVLEPIPAASERGESKIPPGFDAWFAACVARDPAHRFADATSAFAAMQKFAAPPGVVPHATGRPISFGPEALAATSVADAAHSSGPPVAHPLAKTPLPSVALAAAPASTHSTVWPKVSVALALGVAVLLGMRLAERHAATTTIGAPAPLATLPPPPPPTSPVVPSPVPVVEQPSVPSPSAPPSPPPRTSVRPTAENDEEPPRRDKGSRTTVDGFDDPYDVHSEKHRPTIWKVRDHQVRLFTRIVKNQSNVADIVVRGAIDYSAWHYLRCYEGTFDGLRTLPGGVVTVGFDIEDQLPRRASATSSTFTSAAFDSCVARMLLSQTMNAAGQAGAGHVDYAFKFVALDN